jgi:hypothetical protein
MSDSKMNVGAKMGSQETPEWMSAQKWDAKALNQNERHVKRLKAIDIMLDIIKLEANVYFRCEEVKV